MLSSIKAQNYRNLTNLSIEKLGRVNLIIGKNNTGKTSLLEALYLLVAQDDVDVIAKIVASRGENRLIDAVGNESERTLQIINNLFSNRNEGNVGQIEIMAGDDYLRLAIQNVKTPDEVLGGKVPTKYYMIQVERNEFFSPRHILLTGPVGEMQYFPPISDNVLNPKNVKFVRSTLTSFTNSNQLASYLDSVSLGDNYKEVIEALKIIDSDIERIAFLADSTQIERFPVVRLTNGRRVSLLSMGDGINRILTIVLALVNCENGYLLIDEFENGLHYSVQEKLWKIIFHLAERLNIQVFATTHSNDAITSFENVVNKNELTPLNGLLIKLESIEGKIEALVFEPDELKVITDNLIEVRR